MKVLQINVTANSGSHGRIAAGIGKQLITAGHRSFIAYGRSGYECGSELVKIGGTFDLGLHLLKTRLLDRHCFGSFYATRAFINKFKMIDPDVVHLHNVHGYYLNVDVLFRYLRDWGKPVIWTFHDTWPITGHCSFFEHMNCYKWQTECFACPNIHGYPKSWFIDNSMRNYKEKKTLFSGLKNLVLVSPSEWLAGHLRHSFLSGYEIRIINNGVDISRFRPEHNGVVRQKYGITKEYILGVANIWDDRKGLKDFVRLREVLDRKIEIVLVGLAPSQIKALGEGIKGIRRTESIDELASLYSGAKVFVNPTYLDNFPMVNIEALACGTPVITYHTGGSPESIDTSSGRVVVKGDIGALNESINSVINTEDLYKTFQCRERAVNNFSAEARYKDYVNLYQERLTCS